MTNTSPVDRGCSDDGKLESVEQEVYADPNPKAFPSFAGLHNLGSFVRIVGSGCCNYMGGDATNGLSDNLLTIRLAAIWPTIISSAVSHWGQ